MYPSSVTTIVDAQRTFRKAKKPCGSAAPSARAQEVFHRVVVNFEKQCDVAQDMKISPGRVSQHVSRVRQWLAQGSAGDPEIQSHFDRQRLERRLAKARHELL